VKYLSLIIVFLFFFLISGSTWAGKGISFGGFMSLDLVDYQKQQGRVDEFNSGIGVLDLKVYGDYDKFSSKVKLDLDDSKINEAYNIFEEVTATYHHSNKVKVTAGKGVVPFHSLHWGVLQNCYIDSGSLLGASNSWRDLDNNVVTIVKYGNKEMGHISSFTYYGKSKEIDFDSHGEPRRNSYGEVQYEVKKTFSSKIQRGLAYKLDFFPLNSLELSVAATHYHHDYNPRDSFAFDFGGVYKKSAMEIWFEFIHGFTSSFEGASRYAALKVYESLGEGGFEYFLKNDLSLLFNTGVVFVNQVNFDGSEDRIDNYKVDLGLGIYLSKESLITVGALGELQKKNDGGAQLEDRRIVELASKLSFWF